MSGWEVGHRVTQQFVESENVFITFADKEMEFSEEWRIHVVLAGREQSFHSLEKQEQKSSVLPSVVYND